MNPLLERYGLRVVMPTTAGADGYIWMPVDFVENRSGSDCTMVTLAAPPRDASYPVGLEIMEWYPGIEHDTRKEKCTAPYCWADLALVVHAYAPGNTSGLCIEEAGQEGKSWLWVYDPLHPSAVVQGISPKSRGHVDFVMRLMRFGRRNRKEAERRKLSLRGVFCMLCGREV